MKNIVIFGASGQTGKYIVRKMQSVPEFKVSVFVRNPEKLSDVDLENVNVIQGDALKPEDVKKAMIGQDALLASLEGDVLTMANNIVSALSQTSVKRIIWITGFGIHNEIKGIRGKMLAMYVKSNPDYIKAADTIAASNAVTTLLRCPMIQDGNNEDYFLTKEGEQPRNKDVDRASIAKCMADMLFDESIGVNDSLAITN